MPSEQFQCSDARASEYYLLGNETTSSLYPRGLERDILPQTLKFSPACIFTNIPSPKHPTSTSTPVPTGRRCSAIGTDRHNTHMRQNHRPCNTAGTCQPGAHAGSPS